MIIKIDLKPAAIVHSPILFAMISLCSAALPNIGSHPLARRVYSCKSCSLVNPIAPKTWCAVSVIRLQASPTNDLAIDTSRVASCSKATI